MLFSLSLTLPLLALPFGGLAAETVHGVVVFSRHGDRTSKFFPPTRLTALGQNQMYNSGAFYRSRYINSNSTSHISGISAREVVSSQLYAAAPDQVSHSWQSWARTRAHIGTDATSNRTSLSTPGRRFSRAFIPHSPASQYRARQKLSQMALLSLLLSQDTNMPQSTPSLALTHPQYG